MIKGILKDRMIKGFESQEKSDIKIVSESINFCLVKNKDEPIIFWLLQHSRNDK
jgi:hypothetical protein